MTSTAMPITGSWRRSRYVHGLVSPVKEERRVADPRSLPKQDALDPNGVLAPGKQGIWPNRYRHLREANPEQAIEGLSNLKLSGPGLNGAH